MYTSFYRPFLNYKGKYHLLTNFNTKENLEHYKKSLNIYNALSGKGEDMFISKEAYTIDGYRLYHMSALLCKEVYDKSEFWRIYENIKKGIFLPEYEVAFRKEKLKKLDNVSRFRIRSL